LKSSLEITFSDDLPALVAGWGITNLATGEHSDRLKVIDVKVIEWRRCKMILRRLQIHHVCAGILPWVKSEGACNVHHLFTL
jgi:hypothetical protein